MDEDVQIRMQALYYAIEHLTVSDPRATVTSVLSNAKKIEQYIRTGQ